MKNFTKQSWNALAHAYQNKFMELTIYNNSYQKFLDYLPSNASILELGCGPGNITHQLLTLEPQLQITATDYAPEMLKLAQKNNPQANHQLVDCKDLSVIKSQFTGIIGGFVLPYLNQKEVLTFILHCASLVKKEGIIYLSFVPNKNYTSQVVTGNSTHPMLFHKHPISSIKEALTTNNFKILEQIEVGYTSSNQTEIHAIFIAQKK